MENRTRTVTSGFGGNRLDDSTPDIVVGVPERANTSIGNIVAAHRDDGGKIDPMARSGLIEVIVHTRGEVNALQQMQYSDLEQIAVNTPIIIEAGK